MLEHAKNLEFEQAAAIRDEIGRIREIGGVEAPAADGGKGGAPALPAAKDPGAAADKGRRKGGKNLRKPALPAKK
jgi:excinuclease UvrABC nuclease subunit